MVSSIALLLTLIGHNPVFISTLREPSVHRKNLRALTLVGPPMANPEPDLLAVLHFDNPLCMSRIPI